MPASFRCRACSNACQSPSGVDMAGSTMLKHVQISPMRSRADSLSMRSSTSCASSLCGSPEPPGDQLRSHSRASSYSSLNETIPQNYFRSVPVMETLNRSICRLAFRKYLK
uniref:Uncharacterized protein n=1 Tax=Anopheles culicifacies TaxID=139723 RepID=A0A182M4J7_9DIPT